MAIHITGYSQSPVPPGNTTHPLPTIHVEGESIGSDRSPHDVRRVKGTVGMIGDGAIRWSLVSRTLFFASCCYTLRAYYTNAKSDSKVSSAPGSCEPQWSKEAVQIGGPGAALGLLGLWTGALHERPDPLGECCCFAAPGFAC
jgi:hypothetical protein